MYFALMGIPGCGKSSVASELRKKDFLVVERDDLEGDSKPHKMLENEVMVALQRNARYVVYEGTTYNIALTHEQVSSDVPLPSVVFALDIDIATSVSRVQQRSREGELAYDTDKAECLKIFEEEDLQRLKKEKIKIIHINTHKKQVTEVVQIILDYLSRTVVQQAM